MSFIDTHAHLYSDSFEEDRDAMLERTFAFGVEKVFLPNIDSSSIEGMLALEQAYPDRLYPMMGLHPCSVQPDTWESELAIVASWLEKRSFCAIGEIGMDLYWDKSTQEIQAQAFKIQCEWANEYDLPIVIHSRESIDELIALIREIQFPGFRGIFHCFSGTASQAAEIVELGFLLGIGGPLTYKKSTLPEALQDISLDHMVLETDAPYLPPTPHRGKRNESSYIPLVAQKLAEVKGVSVGEVATLTTRNALQIYGISGS